MYKSNVIILHGAYGYPDENWFGWMREELEKLSIQCIVPCMPTPHGQSLNSWLEVFGQKYLNYVNEDTILIGHSLGAAFLMKWLERVNIKVRATVLVGVFIGNVGIEKFDSINETFFVDPFDWETIKKNSGKIFCYYGSNDPYVSPSHFDYIANNLNAHKILISDGGHFNVATGYTSFPHLLIHLKRLIEENNHG